MKMNKKEIGNRIKSIRKYRGLTREEFAQKLNVSKYTIANYEQGQRGSNMNVLSKIAVALDVPINELIDSDFNKSKYELEEALYRQDKSNIKMFKTDEQNVIKEIKKAKSIDELVRLGMEYGVDSKEVVKQIVILNSGDEFEYIFPHFFGYSYIYGEFGDKVLRVAPYYDTFETDDFPVENIRCIKTIYISNPVWNDYQNKMKELIY